MTFEETFFGPGNRLRWDAIQAGSLPRDVQDRLDPFLDDLRRNPEVLVLPRVRDSGQVQWYILCSSPRAARNARDEVRAFLGPSYCDSSNQFERLDQNDSVEASVLARCGSNAFRLDVSEHAILDIARERLRLLIRLRGERPARHARRLRAVGRVLRDFEYALLMRDETAARGLIDELRSSGHLGAANLLFLEVRCLAVGGYGDAILALPELDALIAMPRPRRVTEALIGAVYRSCLQQFEVGRHASDAIGYFRSDILPRFRDLYRSRAGLAGYEVDVSFLLADLASAPDRLVAAEAVLERYPPGSSHREYLTILAALGEAPVRLPESDILAAARAAFGEAAIDRAYSLVAVLPPSFERTALLIRCARDMGTLSAAQVALESVEGLSEDGRSRLAHNAVLARIVGSLKQLSAAGVSAALTDSAVVELPTTWAMWLTRLTLPESWSSAVSVAETASREWSVDNFARDPLAVQEVADLLLRDRASWGQEALRDALPYFLTFCLRSGLDPRLKVVFESLFFVIAVDDQVSLPQVSVLLKVVDVRLQLGVTVADYRELLGQLTSAINAVDTPSVATIALEAIEIVVNAACPAPSERQGFVVAIAGLFRRWYRRVDRADIVLLQYLAEELGVAEAVTQPEAVQDKPQLQSEWNTLDGKKVALYSLQESALRRAALVVRELCPGVRVNTFHDHVGGSPALRNASATADVFVLATAAAKHAATTFIESHRPSGACTLYARGQGSASLVAALRERLQVVPT